MADYILSTCSAVDLPKYYLGKRNIKYLCFRFTMDGKRYLDDFWHSIPYKDFYSRIREGAMPTTSHIRIEEYLFHFKALLDQGLDVLHLSFSSGLSESANCARRACKELSREYPHRKLYVVDTLCASSGLGLLLDAAYEKKQVGLDITELYHWVEFNKLRLNHWVRVDDLFHLKRGGRISGTSAVFGNILKIKPIIDLNFEGKLIPQGQVSGGKNSLNALVDKMVENAENGLDYSSKVFIGHSDSIEDARYVADMVEDTFQNIRGEVMIYKMGASVGAHIGAGTVALFFFGDRRTF